MSFIDDQVIVTLKVIALAQELKTDEEKVVKKREQKLAFKIKKNRRCVRQMERN
jgi:hypothetical protein